MIYKIIKKDKNNLKNIYQNSQFKCVSMSIHLNKFLDRFIFKQAFSSLLLLFACINFGDNVDYVYLIGAWCNAIISFLYNGIQIPCEKKYISFLGNFDCSYIEGVGEPVFGLSMKKWKMLDVFFVCFVCFYTGCYDYSISLSLILIICAIASFNSYGDLGATIIITISIILTYKKLDKLPKINYYLTIMSILIGPFVYKFLSLPDRWVLIYRYIWHFCCMILVYNASILNVKN